MSNKSEIDEEIQKCNKCELSVLKYNVKNKDIGYGKLLGWFGGNDNAEFMFLGMNPSFNRYPDLEYAFGGKNFSKETGIEFIKILNDVGILCNSYITNVHKCSSEYNTIDFDNCEICSCYLKEELELVKSKVLITLGNVVSKFVKYSKSISEYLIYSNMKVINIYHPNYVISYNKNKLKEYTEIIKKIKDNV